MVYVLHVSINAKHVCHLTLLIAYHVLIMLIYLKENAYNAIPLQIV